MLERGPDRRPRPRTRCWCEPSAVYRRDPRATGWSTARSSQLDPDGAPIEKDGGLWRARRAAASRSRRRGRTGQPAWARRGRTAAPGHSLARLHGRTAAGPSSWRWSLLRRHGREPSPARWSPSRRSTTGIRAARLRPASTCGSASSWSWPWSAGAIAIGPDLPDQLGRRAHAGRPARRAVRPRPAARPRLLRAHPRRRRHLAAHERHRGAVNSWSPTARRRSSRTRSRWSARRACCCCSTGGSRWRR